MRQLISLFTAKMRRINPIFDAETTQGRAQIHLRIQELDRVQVAGNGHKYCLWRGPKSPRKGVGAYEHARIFYKRGG